MDEEDMGNDDTRMPATLSFQKETDQTNLALSGRAGACHSHQDPVGTHIEWSQGKLEIGTNDIATEKHTADREWRRKFRSDSEGRMPSPCSPPSGSELGYVCMYPYLELRRDSQ
jgi:hypothetical protein